MKTTPKITQQIPLCASLLLLAGALSTHANIYKAATATMSAATDWATTPGGATVVAPTAGVIGEFGATPSAANLSGMSLGASTSLLGLLFDNNMAGPLTVASGNTLTLGPAGLNLTSATNVTLNCTLSLSGSQSWNVTNGATLAVQGLGAAAGSSIVFNGPATTNSLTATSVAATGTITTTNAGSSASPGYGVLVSGNDNNAYATVGLYDWASTDTSAGGAGTSPYTIIGGSQVSGFYYALGNNANSPAGATSSPYNFDFTVQQTPAFGGTSNVRFSSTGTQQFSTMRYNSPNAPYATVKSGDYISVGGILITPRMGYINAGLDIVRMGANYGDVNCQIVQNNTSAAFCLGVNGDPAFFDNGGAAGESVVKSGAGTLFLNPGTPMHIAFNYTNSSGALATSASTYYDSALSGSSTWAAFYLNGGVTVINSGLQLGNPSSGNQSTTAGGSGTVNLNGGTLMAASTTANGGVVVLTNSTGALRDVFIGGNGGGLAAQSGTTFTVNGYIAGAPNVAGTLTIGIPASSANGNVAGLVPGTGTGTANPAFNATGTVILNGAGNGYAGGTIITAGATLNINSVWALGGAVYGGLTFNSGTLQYNSTPLNVALDITENTANGTGGTNGGAAEPVTLVGNGAIDVNGNTVVYTNGIGNGGSGTFTFINSTPATGSLTLLGANNYTNTTFINSGRLVLGASGSLNSQAINVGSGGKFDVSAFATYNLAAGQALLGSGVVTGSVSAASSAMIIAGTTSTAGTLSFSNNLTLNTGETNYLNLASPSGPNSLISVAGTLNLAGSPSVLDLNFTAIPVAGTYRLITYGAKTGTVAANIAYTLSGYGLGSLTAALNDTGSEIDLVLTSPHAAAPITWLGDGINNNWDTTSLNWTNITAQSITNYFDTDFVTFNDLGSTNPAVNLTKVLAPGSVTVSSTNDYTFSGPGQIGTGSLTKSNVDNLFILTTNTLPGPVVIQGGTLQLGNGTVSGTIGTGSVTNNAALIMNSPIRVATGPITGTGNVTIEANGTLAIGGNSTMNTLTLGGSSTYGILDLTNSSLTVSNLASGASATTSYIGNGGTTASATINYLGGNSTFGGVIEDALGSGTKTVALNVSAAASLSLTGANTYSGGTVINNSTVTLTGSGSLGSGLVTLNGGTLNELTDTINNTITNIPSTASTLTFSNGTGGGYYPTVTVVGGGTLNLNLLGTGVFTPSGTMAAFGGTVNVSGGIRSGYVEAASIYGSANATWNFGSAGSLYNKYGNQTVYFGALDGVSGSSLSGGSTANGLAATIFVVGNLNTTSTFGGVLQDGLDYVGLTKVGIGALILSGANNYSDPTIVSNGTLEVDGSLGQYSATTNYAGATLAGTGTFYGPVDMQPGSMLAPGISGAGNYGTLNFSDEGSISGNGLSMNGCTNLFDISSSTNDLVNVTGGLSLAGLNTIKLNISGTLADGTYTLFTYDSLTSGSVSGNMTVTPVQVGNQSFTLVDTGSSIKLQALTLGTASLTWATTGVAADNDWNVNSSLDWSNSANMDVEVFLNGDQVTFNDSGAANSPVNIQEAVSPRGVTVNSSSNYVFSTTGGGQIFGTMTNGFIKSGSGTLTILTGNNYTGPTLINSGVVQVGDGSTLGTTLSAGNVTNNALLVFNQPDNSAIAGTLTGSGSLVQEGAGTLTVEGNSTFTGTNLISTGTLQFGTGGATAIPTNQFVLANGGTLALDRSGTWYVTNGMVGNGGVTFSGPGTNLFGGVNNYVNNTIVAEGTVRLLGPAVIPSGGATTGWLILDGGASAAGTVDLNGYNQTVNELSGLTGTVLGTILNNGGTGTNTLTISTLANEDAVYAGLIEDNSGAGGEVAVVVEGDGTNTFSGANTYSGGTTVYGPATLLVGASGSLGTGMTTLMGGTLGSSVGLLALDGDKVTVPGGTNGLIVMSPNMHLPALYGAGALGIDINGTTPGGHSTSYGDCLSACANFDGVLNVTGMVSTAVLVCNFNQPGGDTFDGQLQNATVNLYTGAGGGVNLAGADYSAGNTVQLGAINVDASSFLGGAALNGTLTYQIGALGTLSDIEGAVSGNGAIIKVGTGELLLNGSDSYTGNTTINGGSVVVGASSFMASSPAITLAAGTVLDVSAANPTYVGGTVPQTLSGSGTVIGNVSVANSTIIPGGSGTVGTLTVSGNLALTGNVTNTFNIPDLGAGGLLAVSGTLDISGSGNVINLNPLNTAIPAGTYTLATFTGGSLLSSSSPVPLGGITNYVQLAGAILGQTRNITISNSASAILLVVGNGSSLVWSGDGSANQWNLTNSPDWAGGNVFYQDDSVLFNNSSPNQTVNVTGALAPAVITVNSASNYVFTSTGKITGDASIALSGPGSLTIKNSGGNDYSGQVNITGGTLVAGVATALGSTNGATVISGTGALDVGGFNLGAEPVTVSGSGSGNGAILNSGATAIDALQYVTLAGDTTFGGPNRWDIRANTNGYLAGNNYNLTKVGTNDIYLVGLGQTALTNILVTQGRIGVQNSTLLGTNGTLTLFAGAGVDLYLTTVTNTKSVSMTNATISSSDGTNVYAGSINLNGTGYFTATTPLILNGVLGGSGGLVQNGAGTLTLVNAETYSGITTVSNGVLALTGSAALASSPTLDVTAGAVLDVSGLSGGLLTLASGQTLEGNGTVNDNVTGAAGSTVTAGEGAIGTLTVTNTLTLAGNTFLKINRDGAPTADEIVAATINYGGTLTVTNLNLTDPLQLGDSFKLFKGAYNGSFASVILPSLSAGLGWANTLSANGSITVVSAPTLGTNDYLATLVVSNNLGAVVGLTPAFATNGYAYYATNTLPASQVNVTVVNEDATATNTLFLNGVSQGQLPSGSASPLLALTAGSNNVTVQVVSQNLANTNNYTVSVYDLPSLVSPKLTNSVSGGTLHLSWDANHLGYRLLMQTNNLSRGISTNGADWGTVAGSTVITATNILIPKTSPTNGFYRLVYP